MKDETKRFNFPEKEYVGSKIEIEGHEFTIPTDIFKEYADIFRFYSLDDIADLKENYDVLSRRRDVPPRVRSFYFRKTLLASLTDYKVLWNILKGLKSGKSKDLSDDEHFEILTESTLATNLCMIDNVHLKYLKFIKKPSLEGCELVIFDNKGYQMNASFVYKSNFSEKSGREVLTNILSGDDTTSFDVMVTAMIEYMYVQRGSKFEKRGKQLYLHSANKRNSDGEKTNPLEDLLKNSPTRLIGQFAGVRE